MQITVEDALEAGDKVVRRLSWLTTHQGTFLGVPPTGRRVRGHGIVILRITDGKIAVEWEVSDLLGLFQQLSAIPTFQSDTGPA